MIFGVDEVGRGPWAGPLVACAFAAPDESWFIEGLNDSKSLSDKKLVILSKELMREHPKQFELVWIAVEELDAMGLHRANMHAMEQAIFRLADRLGVPDRVIVDGVHQPTHGAECVIDADALFPTVMAASIIAKVARDEYMVRQSLNYPEWGFDRHVGYGTAAHKEAIARHGICPLHRRCFKPIKKYLQTQIPTLGAPP